MYNLDPNNFYWLIGGTILFVALGLDWDWKRRLFETYDEKLKRSEKFRDKVISKKLKHLQDHHGWPK